MSIKIDIKLKRADKIYCEGETVTGSIAIDTPTDLKHDGIILTMQGSVTLQISPRNVGILDAFYGSVKPIQLLNAVCEVCSPGRFPSGVTDIPFEIPLKSKTNRILYETYHGVYININYDLRCEIKRTFLSKDIYKMQQFLIQKKPPVPRILVRNKLMPVPINLSPDTLAIGGSDAPDFSLTGYINSTTFESSTKRTNSIICDASKPLTGKLRLTKCSLPVRSLELQLVRVETCGCAEGFAKESTEIQNIQIGDGDIPLNVDIPIYMIFPRLFTCPTLIEHNFKIEFEINIVIIFENDNLVTDNFPIILVR